VRGPVGFTNSFTPAERMLAQRGVYWQESPPPGAPRLTLTVRDKGGIDCDGALYIFAAWRDLEASVWVTREGAGTIHLIDRAKPRQERVTRSAQILSARFPAGAEITVTAAGPDAHEALGVCREMLEAHPMDRREMYRKRRERRTA
jgi:phosphotransferase system HPr-like phosphotransfer protein